MITQWLEIDLSLRHLIPIAQSDFISIVTLKVVSKFNDDLCYTYHLSHSRGFLSHDFYLKKASNLGDSSPKNDAYMVLKADCYCINIKNEIKDVFLNILVVKA